MKITPKKIVIAKPRIVFPLSPLIMAWCDHVTVAPDVNKIAVFNSGTSNGFKAFIPTGGHIAPISTVGPNDEWKKAQKNEKKKQTSDMIKNNIPNLKPLCTTNV